MSLSCFPKKPATRTPQTPTFNIQTGIEEGYAAWPPRVVDTRHLGYINAKDTYFYSQDIGRSFRLGGRTYIIFGDTFCNDHGISSNTYKIIPDLTVPTQAFYLSGPHNGYIHPLIEPTRAETEWLALPENLGVKRLAFWCYGGVVEFADGIGWTWYQKYVVDTTTTTAGGGVLDLIGVGLARLSVNNNNNNNNNKKSGGGSNNNGELSAARMPGLMFEQAEGHPLFGSFSTLLAGSHVYLWGQIASSDVFLARVHKDDCHLRHKYTYWNGSAYTDDISRAAPVLQDYQQGAFFHAPQLFGERLAWCFVGVTKWGDSTVMMGKAERVEGPWDDVRPVTHAYGIKNPEGYRYCVYPHPLLLEGGRGRGRVVVSWSENWPGGVIAVELELEREPLMYWAEIGLEGLAPLITTTALTTAAQVCPPLSVEFSLLPPSPSPSTSPTPTPFPARCLRLQSTDREAVERALGMVRRRMEEVVEEGGDDCCRIV